MTTEAIEDQITLEYSGPLVERGSMNSYEVAGYIIAFSDFLGVASRNVYGERVSLRTEIQGFRNGSFDIDFALKVAGVAAGLFMTETPVSLKDLIEAVRTAIKAWIHLGGKPPKTVKADPERNDQFQIENQGGQITYITANVVNIVTDPKAGKAAEQFIGRPLESGLDHVHLRSASGEEIATIRREEGPSFVPVNMDKPLMESEIQMGLLIESPAFKDGNKWRFFDGQSSFHADILDDEFLKKVDSGVERFGKGDELIARVRFTQSSSPGSLKMERSIVKVIRHEIAHKPDKLFE